MPEQQWSHSAVKRAAKLLLSKYGERPALGRSKVIDAHKPFMYYDFRRNRVVYAQPYDVDDLYVRVIEYLIRIGEYDAVSGDNDDFQFTRPTVLLTEFPFRDAQFSEIKALVSHESSI